MYFLFYILLLMLMELEAVTLREREVQTASTKKYKSCKHEKHVNEKARDRQGKSREKIREKRPRDIDNMANSDRQCSPWVKRPDIAAPTVHRGHGSLI